MSQKTDKPEKRKRTASSGAPKQPGVKRSKSTGVVSKQQPAVIAPLAPLGSAINSYVQESTQFFANEDDDDLLSECLLLPQFL